jgi:hypothetical protein
MAELRTEKRSINKITLQKLKHGKGYVQIQIVN